MLPAPPRPGLHRGGPAQNGHSPNRNLVPSVARHRNRPRTLVRRRHLSVKLLAAAPRCRFWTSSYESPSLVPEGPWLLDRIASQRSCVATPILAPAFLRNDATRAPPILPWGMPSRVLSNSAVRSRPPNRLGSEASDWWFRLVASVKKTGQTNDWPVSKVQSAGF